MSRSCFRQVRGWLPEVAILFPVVLMVSIPRDAVAQPPVVDPRIVQFTPSVDHYAMLPDGRPVVERYTFSVYRAGGTQPFETVDIGKPAPGADGTIQYDFSARVSSWLLPGGPLEARVDAVGPGGDGLSLPSNTFIITGGCSYEVSASSSQFPPEGGGGLVDVATGGNCGWSARSNDGWVTVSRQGGTGRGSVAFTVLPNPGNANRTGTLTIADATYTVNQQGAGCGFSLSTYTQSADAAGATDSVAVTSAGVCSWTAASNAWWIAVTSGSAGTGNGLVTYTVDPNPSALSRTGTLTIGGFTLTINQSAPTTEPPSTTQPPTQTPTATSIPMARRPRPRPVQRPRPVVQPTASQQSGGPM